jgi:hypothetical protein
VVEPSLAALLFYGVCRILPQRLLAADGKFPGLSFSTYDPSPDRATTTLVATVCSGQGVDGDLPSEAYKRGFVCNTFVPEFRYGVVSEPGKYVAHVAEFLQRESRIPDEVIREYDALPELSITGIDALPALADDLVRYLHGADRLARYPQLTEKAAGGMTPAGKSLRSALVRKRLESLSPPYPPDLLEVVVDWLGDELAGDWKAKGTFYQALLPILPSSEKELEGLIQQAGSKLSQDIRDDAVIKVTLANNVLPKTLALMAASEKSSSKLNDALRRTIERLRAEKIEDIFKDTIERHADSYLQVFAKHFDALASVGRIQDRLPLQDLLLKRTFSGSKLRSFEKWGLLEACSRSMPARVPDDFWNDGMWCADHLEECFRGVRTQVDLEKRALAAKEWTKWHDAAKLPETQLAPLVDPWMKLLVAVDALRDGKEKSKEQCRDSGLAIVSAATSLVPEQLSAWQPSESEIRGMIARAVALRCESDADKQRIAEVVESVQQESQALRLREIQSARWKNKRKNWIRSAKQLAARFALPAAISIAVLALLAALVVLVPRYLSQSLLGETTEAKKTTSPQEAPASKAKPRRVAEAPLITPASEKDGVKTASGRNKSTKNIKELPPGGSAPSTSSIESVPSGAAQTPPASSDVATPSDAWGQVRQAVEQAGHVGVISPTSRSIKWANANGALAMPPVQLRFPIDAEHKSAGETIRIAGPTTQGEYTIQYVAGNVIAPPVAKIVINGEGITLAMDTRETYGAGYATLFPLILEGLGDPSQSTWLRFDAETRWEPFPLVVNSREPIIKDVLYPPYGLLKDRIHLEVGGDSSDVGQGRSVFRLANGESSAVSLGQSREVELEWSPAFGSRTYPAVVDARVDPLDRDLGLRLTAQLRVGFFWSSMKSGIAIAPEDGAQTAGHWVEGCARLMQDSLLWQRLLEGEKPLERLKQAFLALESDAAECVREQGNCISFLREAIVSRRVTDVSQPWSGPVKMSPQKGNGGRSLSIADRVQSLKAILQASRGFRGEVLRKVSPGDEKGVADMFPFSRLPAVKGQEQSAEKTLRERIDLYESQSRKYFEERDFFEGWCWRTVRDAEEKPSDVAILAGLWLTISHTRDSSGRSQDSMVQQVESLNSSSSEVPIRFRIIWKSSEWGCVPEELIDMCPYGVRLVTKWPSGVATRGRR